MWEWFRCGINSVTSLPAIFGSGGLRMGKGWQEVLRCTLLRRLLQCEFIADARGGLIDRGIWRCYTVAVIGTHHCLWIWEEFRLFWCETGFCSLLWPEHFCFSSFLGKRFATSYFYFSFLFSSPIVSLCRPFTSCTFQPEIHRERGTGGICERDKGSYKVVM